MRKNMHKEILDSVFKLGGKRFSDSDYEKYQYVVDKAFAEQTKEDITEKYAEAETLLFPAYPQLKKSEYDEQLVVRSLGKMKNKDNINIQEEIYKSAENLANAFTAFEEDIMISFVHKVNQGNSRNDLVISSNGGSREIAGMIRGAFGQAKTELNADKPMLFEKQYYGQINIPHEKPQKQEQKKKSVSWCDVLSNSIATGENYSVSIRICPTSDSEYIEKRIKHLVALHDFLNDHSESNVSCSSNISTNRTHEYSLINAIKNKIGDWFKGKERVGFNYSGSINQGSKENDKYAKSLMEQIDEELYRLQRGKQSCLWSVEVMVSSDDESTIQTVASILGGTLKSANLELSWTDEKCTSIIAGTKEIVPMLLFPTKEFNGLTFFENEEFSLEQPEVLGCKMNIGNIMQNTDKISPFYLTEKSFERHAFICGMTGSGKTNTLHKIIETTDIPFLVIEPVKGEYRSLKNKYNNLNIMTMKTEDTAADILQINPFWFPENANIAFHIDSIKTIISSAFDLSAAMPNILEQCLYNIYIKSGWNLVSNKNIYKNILPEKYLYPTFSDLCREVEDYLEHAEFGDELMGDYKGAMLSRLRSFVNGFKGVLLNTSEHPDYEMLMTEKNVIELEGLADDADKCLVMGTILIQYYEYLKLHFNDEEKGLKHLTVIEEAHRLFKNVQKKNKQDGPDMVGQLVESLSNIMAEIRAFGEGFIIVDQSPTKISTDVIKNSATKIVHRIDDGEDIKILQSCLLLPNDCYSIPSLKQGEALIRSDGMLRPCKVLIHRSEIKDNYSLSSSFQSTSNSCDDKIATRFAAAAVLNNKSTEQEIQDMVIAMLVIFSKDGFNNWYDTVNSFLKRVIMTMKEHRNLDLLDGRLQVMLETISHAIMSMHFELSFKERGCIHMFIMRMIELYYKRKDEYKVRDLELKLMSVYLKNNIEDGVKKYIVELND